jgi:hypothetical protein
VYPQCAGFGQNGKDAAGSESGGPPHLLSENPGDYEIKVLWQGHLARSIKFTVNSEGKFGNGLAAANKLGSHRTIVPVQIVGDQGGRWDRAAWQTEAFYGNPLTDFTAVPEPEALTAQAGVVDPGAV